MAHAATDRIAGKGRGELTNIKNYAPAVHQITLNIRYREFQIQEYFRFFKFQITLNIRFRNISDTGIFQIQEYFRYRNISDTGIFQIQEYFRFFKFQITLNIRYH